MICLAPTIIVTNQIYAMYFIQAEVKLGLTQAEAVL